VKYQSSKEARRSGELDIMQRLGEISDLRRQVRYEFVHNDVHICAYVADFVYRLPNGATVVEDTKSAATRKIRIYRVKIKLMKAFFGIDIVES
jgi:hypothetical protein